MIPDGWVLPEKPLFTVRICINKRLNTDNLPNCAGRGSRGLADLLERLITAENLPAEILRGPCMNNCLIGPNLKIQGGALFNLQGDLSEGAIENLMAEIAFNILQRSVNVLMMN